MNKKYIVRLTETERDLLDRLVNTGKAAARALTHARILLKANWGPNGPAWTDEAISTALDVSIPTIERVRRTLVLDGFDAVLQRKPAPPRSRKLDGRQEAHLIALACSSAPAGHKRWTLQLLANHLVELEELDGLSHETVRQILKKRPQTLAEQGVVHSAQGKPGVCSPDGGRVGWVLQTARPEASPGLLR
jgi:transposase